MSNVEQFIWVNLYSLDLNLFFLWSFYKLFTVHTTAQHQRDVFLMDQIFFLTPVTAMEHWVLRLSSLFGRILIVPWWPETKVSNIGVITKIIVLVKVCIILLVHVCFEKSLLTFWQVRCCEHRTRRSCQKYNKDFFQILWPSQKTQTLIDFETVKMRVQNRFYPIVRCICFCAKVEFFEWQISS